MPASAPGARRTDGDRIGDPRQMKLSEVEVPEQDKYEQTPDSYDDLYSSGGYEGIYQLPYDRSHYYPLFKAVLGELKRRGVKQVLEVGCGVGSFAEMLLERSDIDYHGFDFSEIAVNQARESSGRTDAFSVLDATDTASYTRAHDAIVCTEVLEHIPQDLETVASWASGNQFVCSVPNFDASNHERFFSNESEVRSRYGDSLDIERLVRVRKPVIGDIGIANRLRQLRWMRSRPARFVKILGFSSFDEDGGWFVFSGRCR